MTFPFLKLINGSSVAFRVRVKMLSLGNMICLLLTSWALSLSSLTQLLVSLVLPQYVSWFSFLYVPAAKPGKPCIDRPIISLTTHLQCSCLFVCLSHPPLPSPGLLLLNSSVSAHSSSTSSRTQKLFHYPLCLIASWLNSCPPTLPAVPQHHHSACIYSSMHV